MNKTQVMLFSQAVRCYSPVNIINIRINSICCYYPFWARL